MHCGQEAIVEHFDLAERLYNRHALARRSLIMDSVQDPLLAEEVANDKIFGCGDLATGGTICSGNVGNLLPMASIFVAARSLHIERL